MGKGCSQKRSSSTVLRKFQPAKRINGSTSTNEGKQLLTEIYDWNVKQKANGKFVLQGRKSDDPSRLLWRSSSITKRVSSKCFMTTSKTMYKLVGNMNAATAKADGWPHHLITKYSEAIPNRWRYLIQLHVHRNCRRNSYSESCMSYTGSYHLDSRSKSSAEPEASLSPDAQAEDSFFPGIRLQNVALNLIRRNSALFQSVNSTPVRRSSSQHMEINEDIISPIRTDSTPQVITEGHGRVTRRNRPCPNPNAAKPIDLGNVRNKRPTRSTFVPCETDIIDDIPARSTPTPTSPVAAANTRLAEAENVRPVKRATPVNIVPKRLFKLRECKVVLKQINPANALAKPVEEVVAKNVTTKKSARVAKPRVKSRPIKTGKKSVKSGKSGSLNVAGVVPQKNKLPGKNVLECYEGITSKPGTLKHKQQMRQFLNECNDCPSEADFLSRKLSKNGLNKMVGDFVAGNDFTVATDVSSASESGTPKKNVIMTPLSERGTPTSATFSPTYLHTINWKHVDKYMIQRKANQKLKAKQRVLARKPVVAKRKLNRDFLDIHLSKLKLIPVTTGSDEENMETSCEES